MYACVGETVKEREARVERRACGGGESKVEVSVKRETGGWKEGRKWIG